MMKLSVYFRLPLIMLGCCSVFWLLVATSSHAAEKPKPKTPEELAAERAAEQAAALKVSMDEYHASAVPFITKYCVECHGPKTSEAELRLDQLSPDMKTTASAARWIVVLDQMTMDKMPPEDKPRPDAVAAEKFVLWIRADMKRSNKHLSRRQEYANGNKVPHEMLFDPNAKHPFDVPAGVRRLSPEIYSAYTGELAKGATNIGQPFSAEGKTTFKDMGAPKVDEPITSQLIQNALALAERQTQFKIEDGQFKGTGIPKEFEPLLNEQIEPTDEQFKAAITAQFQRALLRKPTDDETDRFVALFKKNIAEAGRITGVRYALAATYLLPESIFRSELGAGQPDGQGRVRLTPREIAFAISYTLTDRRPTPELLKAADEGKLNDAAGVAAAVRKMLSDEKLAKPRIMRFFREYFEYDLATDVFKDDKEYRDHDARALVEDTEKLVQDILAADKDVLRELLTTNRSYVGHAKAAETVRRRKEEFAKFEKEKAADPKKFASKTYKPFGKSVYETYNLPDFPEKQPTELPKDQRAGILTQPAWLVAHSNNDENHAIIRGKFVRERLLGGVVPDIPITVDAQLPIDPKKTLRERMVVTQEEYCFKCHTLMNRLGYPFEMYDHFGRFRTEEVGKPVDASGGIDHTGDPSLDGDTKDSIDFIHKIAASPRVEQVFTRHVFRFFTGRNESLGDAPSLQAAHKAYVESKGSFKELVVAILSSDSFLYRLAPTENK